LNEQAGEMIFIIGPKYMLQPSTPLILPQG